MKSNVFGQAPTADADYKLLLKKVAGKVVILLADDPVFTVFAVSDSYPKAVRQARDAMTGRGFFEILPEGPDLSHAQTMENVRSSFCKVLATQESDTIPVAQQYDLPASSSTGEPFEERHWILISSPVLDAAGSLRFISHEIQDVTERIISERKERANETRQAFLLTLSDAIRPLRNPDAIKGAAARVLGERLQTNRAFYAEVDGDDCVVEERYEHDVDTIPPGRYAADTYGRRIIQTYRAGKKLVFRDARTDPDFAPEERAAHLAIKILAAVGVPLVKEGKLVAILAVHSALPRDSSDEEIALVEQTAERTWASVERARSDASLRESEARFRVLTESLPQLVWSCLPDGRCDYLSSQWVAYTGIPEAEQLDLRWLDRVIHPDDRERTLEHWLGAVAGHHDYDIEYRIRAADGSYRWFQTRGVPLRDTHGVIVKWFGTCTDIQRQKQAEADVRKQWHTFDAVLSHTPDFAYIFNLEGRFTYINRALLQLWHKTFDEAYGKNFFDLDYPPELAARLQRQIQQVIDTKVPVRDHTPFTGSTGQTGYYDYIFVPVVGARGEVEAVAGSTRDITEREEMQRALAASKERLQQVFAQAPVAVAVLSGREMVFELANPFYQAFFPRRELLHQPLLKVLPDVGDKMIAILHSVFETGEPFVGHEYFVPLDRDNDGVLEDYWFTFVYQPLKGANGKTTGIVAVAVDVTTHVRARLALEQANKELEEFAYVASHDLKEPLRTVNVYTQLLLRRHVPDNSQAKEYASFIHESVNRMEALFHDLLTFSRTIHSNDQAVGTANLSEAFAEAASVLKERIEETGARIEVPQLPVVRGETAQLSHVFQNLLSNALKYQSEGVRPEIGIRVSSDEAKWIIAVQDNGIGFEPQYAERIFGLFKRLYKDEYPGTGLGLAICRRIVQRYGGRIWAESTPGCGSTFYFSLLRGEGV